MGKSLILSNNQKSVLKRTFPLFLDVATIGTGKATHYNTKEEQIEAINLAHEALFQIDRGIYAMSCALDGTTDFTKQIAIHKLLKNPYSNDAFLSQKEENIIIRFLTYQLPPQRMLKLYESVKQDRINNSRTRTLILSTILNADNLQLWSVKYRHKIKRILQHAWGIRRASIIKSILEKRLQTVGSVKELNIIENNILNFTNQGVIKSDILECIAFILGDEKNLSLPLLCAYRDAKKDLAKGRTLPYETLEGIRSTYHKNVAHEIILELTKDSLTVEQKRLFQKKAQKENVEIEFDPMKYDAVRLYIYAYENGMTEEIKKALKQKAKRAVESFILKYNKIGVLVDCSGSMFGHKTQKLRPMAIALAVRDMLYESADNGIFQYVGNKPKFERNPIGQLIDPKGSTSLAEGLVGLLKHNPDAVFVITDGYENSPAGRFDEVLRLGRKIGINIPVYQLSPVIGLETVGTRKLSDHVSVLPVSSPASLGIALLRSAFEQEPDNAVKQLYEITKKKIPLLEAA